ncbi:hypothetical protein BKA65DRAFT_272017 [Rhexocercosporidium sp. MPI-PUGE-AT-0058]|nr:hypothetical protein BKA65DRAFT_272017 [Rhexocercosporidium sp. MPI-PUGE-AT-0058]
MPKDNSVGSSNSSVQSDIVTVDSDHHSSSSVSSPYSGVDDENGNSDDIYGTERDRHSLIPHLVSNTNSFDPNLSTFSQFVDQINDVATRIFPNNGKPRSSYRSVKVLLLRWKDDILGVGKELEKLKEVFEMHYGFETVTWLIPHTDSHTRMMSKAVDVLDRHPPDSLLIIYYGGHASLNDNRHLQWSRARNPKHGSLDWSAIQTLFERGNSDVLTLLDCCHAASAISTSGRRVTECIAACGFEAWAPEPGPNSFTTYLINVLTDWSNQSFSVAMLHCEILSRLRHEKPERTKSGKGFSEVRSSPIHIFSSTDPRRASINLSKMRATKKAKFADPMVNMALGDIQKSPIDKINEIQADSLHQVSHQIQPSKELSYPTLIISIYVNDHSQLDVGIFRDWLHTIPLLAKRVVIQGTNSKSGILTRNTSTPHFHPESITIGNRPTSDSSTYSSMHNPSTPRSQCSRDREALSSFMAESSLLVKDLLTRTDLLTLTKLNKGSVSSELKGLRREKVQLNRAKADGSNVATRTTTPRLSGTKRGGDEEFSDHESQYSEEDLLWDVSDSDDDDALEEAELEAVRRARVSDKIHEVMLLWSISLKARIVDLLMGGHSQTFDAPDSRYIKRCAEGSARSNYDTANTAKAGSPQSSNLQPKRKVGNGNPADEGYDEEGTQGKRMKLNSEDSDPHNSNVRWACLYHKHNPTVFGRQNDRRYSACDNMGFKDIPHLKEHLYRAHYQRNKCPRCKNLFEARAFKSHIENAQGCQPRSEFEGNTDIGFSHVFAVGIKVKKPCATLEEGKARWTEMYRGLFPNEPVPASPFVSAGDEVQTIGSQSLESAIPNEGQLHLQPQYMRTRLIADVDALDPTLYALEPLVQNMARNAPLLIEDDFERNYPRWMTFGDSSGDLTNYVASTQPNMTGQPRNTLFEQAQATAGLMAPPIPQHSDAQYAGLNLNQANVSPNFSSIDSSYDFSHIGSQDRGNVPGRGYVDAANASGSGVSNLANSAQNPWEAALTQSIISLINAGYLVSPVNPALRASALPGETRLSAQIQNIHNTTAPETGQTHRRDENRIGMPDTPLDTTSDSQRPLQPRPLADTSQNSATKPFQGAGSTGQHDRTWERDPYI